MHNGRNRIANTKRSKGERRHIDKGHRRKQAPAAGAKRSAPVRARDKTPTAQRPLPGSFPTNAVLPADRASLPEGSAIVVMARPDNLVAERRLVSGRPELMDRAIRCAPTPPEQARPPAVEAEPVSAAVPPALPLPIQPEPLVVTEAPVARERALVAPSKGLFGRIVRWLSGPARRPRAPAEPAPDRPDVALLRAELRELRAQLAIERRMAERRQELVRAGAL